MLFIPAVVAFALWPVAAVTPGGGVSAAPGPVTLSPGVTVERTLLAGGSHPFRAELRAGDFLRLEVDQVDLDVVVSVSSDGGTTWRKIDSPYGQDFPESVGVLAPSEGGSYQFSVRAYLASAEGSYRLEVLTWRPAMPDDRRRAEAEHLTYGAHRRAARRGAGDLRAAAELYLAAAASWRGLGPRIPAAGGEEARARRRLGQLLRRLGDLDGSAEALRDALHLERLRGDEVGAAACLSELGRVLQRRGEHGDARKAYRDALELLDRAERDGQDGLVSRDSRRARIHNNLASSLQATGDLDAALGEFRRALASFRRAEDSTRQAIALINLGHLQSERGRTDLALQHFEEALPLCRGLGRRDLEADLLNNRGVTLERLGELRTALDSYGAARALFRQLGDGRREAAVLSSQASVLLELSRPESASELLDGALAWLRTSPDARLEHRVQTSLGAAARDLGNLDDALLALDHALASLGLGEDRLGEDSLGKDRRAGDRLGEALTRYHRSTVLRLRGEPAAAAAEARRSLELSRHAGHVPGELRALRALGAAEFDLGRGPASRRAWTQLAELAETAGDVLAQGHALYALARLDDVDGSDPAHVLRRIDTALALFESPLAQLSERTVRGAQLRAQGGAYSLAVDLAMRRHGRRPGAGHARRALAYAERSRAGAWTRMLSRSGVGSVKESLNAGDARRLRRELNALAVARRRPGADRGAIDARIHAATGEYRLLSGSDSTSVDGPAVLATDRVRLDAAIDAARRRVGPGTAVLEFALGEPRSYAWVVTADGIRGVELVGRSAIEAAADRLLESLARPAGDRATRRAALDDLSRLVLDPVLATAGDRPLIRRWLVVPDGVLHGVPFAALPLPAASGAGPLIARYEVSFLPSLASLAAPPGRRRRPDVDSAPRLAIIADPVYREQDERFRKASAELNPALPMVGESSGVVESRGHRPFSVERLGWSGAEAEAIASVVVENGGQVRRAEGFGASLEVATSAELGREGWIHIAAHGEVDDRHPELSGVMLSRWGPDLRPRESILRLHDVYELSFEAELLVLSGCSTARGRSTRSHGVLGLAQGFLDVGVETVVASLWPVRDRATAVLMERFYRGLLEDGLTPSAALRGAQLSLRSERRFRDPYFWAPFVVIGGSEAHAR